MIRPVSGDAALVAYLNGGRHPEIAQAARRQALSSADEDAFDSSDSEDNAYYESPSRDANPIEADVVQRADGSSRTLRAIAADALAAGGHLPDKYAQPY
ncbi:Pfs domain-containing protein [Trichoderma simmonsii]|uniref:Pfs domain-containing protein n=1 Tax=Trichoderma simmonsii TaxID=1491479 RepID=A0A8G0KZF5_9HYPO|nr:Pfs domain-containing protein [Trichoderma simmonsii]